MVNGFPGVVEPTRFESSPGVWVRVWDYLTPDETRALIEELQDALRTVEPRD